MTIQKRVWVAVMRKTEEEFQVLLGLRGPDCGNPYTWGLFGGGVDEGEDIREAALREMEEETGIVLESREASPLYIGTSEKLFGDKELHWFVYGSPLKKKDCAITNEVVDYKWASLKEAEGLPLHYSATFFFQGLKALLEETPYKAPVHINLNAYVSVK